jgi:hypothetical protein
LRRHWLAHANYLGKGTPMFFGGDGGWFEETRRRLLVPVRENKATKPWWAEKIFLRLKTMQYGAALISSDPSPTAS